MRRVPHAGVVLAWLLLVVLGLPSVARAAPPTCSVPPGFVLEMDVGESMTLPSAPCADADGDAISIEITQQPTHAVLSPSGTAAIAQPRTLSAITPGEDSFSFRALAGGEASAPVTIALRISIPVVVIVIPDITWDWGASTYGRSGTIFTSLALKGVIKGSTVRVRCAGRSCPRHRQTFRNTGARVRLGAFVGKRLRPATKITAIATHQGRVGVVRTMLIRRAKRPAIQKRCMLPGSTVRRSCDQQ